MPELPEVETTVRGLRPVLEGRRLARVDARRADLRRAFPEDLGQRLTGATVTGLGRRAKFGLGDTDRGGPLGFPPRGGGARGPPARGRGDPRCRPWAAVPSSAWLTPTAATRLSSISGCRATGASIPRN